jgi:hypothetical protein
LRNSFSGELTSEVEGQILEITDLDILMKLKHERKRDTSYINFDIISEGIEYSSDFIERYMLERQIFCAKYRAICKDSTIADSLKTLMYFDEIGRFAEFVRESTENTKIVPVIPIQRSTTITPANITNQNMGSSVIHGDNFNVVQGDNSVFDNSSTYVRKKLVERRVSLELIDSISSNIGKCRGRNVDIRLLSQDFESQQLAADLLKLIEISGLKNVGVMYPHSPSDFLGVRIYVQKDFDSCHALILNQLYYGVPELNWEVVYLTEETNLFDGLMIDIGGNSENYESNE